MVSQCKQPPCTITDDNIRNAVQAWEENEINAQAWYGDIAEWDVSSVTDTSDLFKGMLDFSVNLSAWNMTAVVSTHGMFEGATSFNSDLSGWELPLLKDARYMFSGATSFNGDLS